MKRKDFLRFTGIAGLGVFTGMPLLIANPHKDDLTIEIRSREELWGLLGQFLLSIGAGLAASHIYEYYKYRNDSDVRVGVNFENDYMAEPRNGGFTDLSVSQVYSRTDPYGETFGYQAAAPGSCGSNVCAPIFNTRRSKRNAITMLEGPTMATLVPIAKTYFTSKENANRMLLPIKQITRGVESFDGGSKIPTAYVSKGGNVKITYENKYPGYGEGRTVITNGQTKLLDSITPIYYQC